MVTKEQKQARTDFLESIPWITYLIEAQLCAGYRWSQMPMKAVHNLELRELYRCKNMAHWRFRALKPKDRHINGTSGIYCMHHLYVQLEGMREQARLERWMKKNGMSSL